MRRLSVFALCAFVLAISAPAHGATPAAPTGLKFSTATSSSITWAWSRYPTTVRRYEINYRAVGQTANYTSQTCATCLAFKWSTLQPSRAHEARLRIVSTVGQIGAWTGWVRGSTLARPPATAPAPTPGARLLWGAHIEGSLYGFPQDSTASYDTFEQHAGKKMSLIGLGAPWYKSGQPVPFNPNRLEPIRQRGAIPVLTWAPKDAAGNSQTQPAFCTATIASGTYDVFLRKFAADVAAWPHPLFIRLGWEMNGWWYPWGEGRTPQGSIVNGNQAGDYVNMWRHVHDIFDAAGAHNVTWLWVVNHESIDSKYPSLSSLYPGSAYVDWVGIDAYNKDPKSWLTFSQSISGDGVSWMRNTYQDVLSIAPDKPMMAAEFGSREAGDGGAKKAAWITDALGPDLDNHSAINAIMYYNALDPTVKISIESSAAAQSAFRQGIADPKFAVGTFSAAPASPILAP